jgi:hypothetical protein
MSPGRRTLELEEEAEGRQSMMRMRVEWEGQWVGPGRRSLALDGRQMMTMMMTAEREGQWEGPGGWWGGRRERMKR